MAAVTSPRFGTGSLIGFSTSLDFSAAAGE